MKRICPNCTQPVVDHPQTGCVLAALIGVIRDRGTKPERVLRSIHAKCDINALWDRLGPVIDDLEAGNFTEVK